MNIVGMFVFRGDPKSLIKAQYNQAFTIRTVSHNLQITDNIGTQKGMIDMHCHMYMNQLVAPRSGPLTTVGSVVQNHDSLWCYSLYRALIRSGVPLLPE